MATQVYRELIWIDSERVGGMPCFYGTSVTVASLFDLVGRGHSVEQFVRRSSVPHETVREVLGWANRALERNLDTLISTG